MGKVSLVLLSIHSSVFELVQVGLSKSCISPKKAMLISDALECKLESQNKLTLDMFVGLPSLTAGGPGQFSAASPAAGAAPKLNPFMRGPEAGVSSNPPRGPVGRNDSNSFPGTSAGTTNQVRPAAGKE